MRPLRDRAPALLLVAALTVTGCADQTETYCSTLEEHRQTLADLADSAVEPGADVFGGSLEVFRELRADAPDDLSDEWDTFLFAWEGLADAFDAADLSPSEYQPGRTPDVDAAEERAIAGAADELRSARVVEAGDAIEQHARDVCKVDLGAVAAG